LSAVSTPEAQTDTIFKEVWEVLTYTIGLTSVAKALLNNPAIKTGAIPRTRNTDIAH
jgi:hypothetical protein